MKFVSVFGQDLGGKMESAIRVVTWMGGYTAVSMNGFSISVTYVLIYEGTNL